MRTESFKKIVKFWQEIVFAVLIGLLLIEVARGLIPGRPMDGWDIFLVCYFIPLFTCLVGQFFGKNRVLGFILSIFLGLSSFVYFLMSLYFISTTSTKMMEAIIMFLLGLLLCVSAVTMSIKYLNKLAQ